MEAIDGQEEVTASREASPPTLLALGGRVVNDKGRPIGSARVSWVAWRTQDLEWEPAWQADDWGPLDRSGGEVETSEDGRFTFGGSIDAPHGAVLWASHEGHEAACLLVEAHELRRDDWTIELPAATSLRVRVLDAEGRPAADAVVLQYGATPSAATRDPDGRNPERARRLLVRRFDCGASGEQKVGPFPGEQVFLAVRGSQRSMPWRGVPGTILELRLSNSFTIGGSVRLPDWSHLNYQGEQRLLVEASSLDERISLLSERGIVDGDWGPFTLPILPDAVYSLRLDGSPIVPLLQEFPAPEPGSQLQFHLAPILGNALSIHVVDEEGRAIPEAEVASFWVEEGRERVLRRRGSSEGLIDNWSFPDGARVRSLVSAPGFAGSWTDEVEFPEPYPGTHRVVLERAAVLTGRCLHEGRPVADFDVVAWRPRRAGFTQITETFRGREDGRFELDSVPRGELLVSASNSAFPNSNPVAVVAPNDREVVLHLESPLPGRGQVVDLQTGEPVATARAQVLTVVSEGLLSPWGRQHAANAEGRFELSGFHPGRCSVRISAEGYADREVSGFADSSGVDFGRILLDRPRPLELRIFSDEPVSIPGCTAVGGDKTPLPRESFDAQGRVRFENASAGLAFVRIEGAPQSSWASLRLILEPGREWCFSHKVGGRRRLVLEIVGKSDEPPSAFLGLSVGYESRAGIDTELGLPFQPSGALTVDGIDSDSAHVTVMGPLGIGVGALTTLRGDELHARLDLGGEPFDLLVVDEAHVPVPGALVRVVDSEATALYFAAVTNAEGVCSFRGLPQRTILVSVAHETHGQVFGVAVDATAGAAEVVLGSMGAIELALRDGADPVPGVEAKALVTALGPRWSPLGVSDALGRIRANGLGIGMLQVTTEHPDCWPASLGVASAKDPVPTVVQVRRLGGLSFLVRAPDGQAISGLPLALESLEFDQDVGAWIAEGLVSAPAGLRTGSDGTLRIERIPRGSYRWSVVTGPEVSVSGTCEVVPGAIVQVPVLVP